MRLSSPGEGSTDCQLSLMSPEEQRGVTNTKQSLCLILQIIHSVILQTSVSKVSADQYEAVLLLTYRCMILRSISELSWAGGGDRRSQLWLHSALLSSSPPPVSPSSLSLPHTSFTN